MMGKAREDEEEVNRMPRRLLTSRMSDSLLDVPVEGPLEEELSGSLGEVATSLVSLQHLVDDSLQPVGPLLQRVLLL